MIKPRIALFFGKGLIGNDVLQQIVPHIIDMGFEPVVYSTRQPKTKKAVIPELAGTGFYETTLLENITFPYIDAQPPLLHTDGQPMEGVSYSFRLLAQIYGIEHHDVPNVNAPDFIEKIIADDRVMGAVSVRNYQIFKPEIISVLEQKGFLWNLHTGILPQYKGVYIPYRSIENGEKEYGWTLHRVDHGIDTGEILAIDKIPLDATKPVLDTYLDMVPKGAGLIIENLRTYLENGPLYGRKQTPDEKKSYYAYPTGSEMRSWEARGVRFMDIPDIPDIYVSRFSVPNSTHSQGLRKSIIQAIAEYERRKPAPAKGLNFPVRASGS